MTHTRTTVTLDRSDWRRVLACMKRGITVLASRSLRSQRTSGRSRCDDHTVLDDYPHVQDARWGLHDHIEEQIDGQYDGEPETLNRNVVSFSSVSGSRSEPDVSSDSTVESDIADHSEGMSQTLDDMIVHLEDEFDMSRSLHAEELGRKYAHLRD